MMFLNTVKNKSPITNSCSQNASLLVQVAQYAGGFNHMFNKADEAVLEQECITE